MINAMQYDPSLVRSSPASVERISWAVERALSTGALSTNCVQRLSRRRSFLLREKVTAKEAVPHVLGSRASRKQDNPSEKRHIGQPCRQESALTCDARLEDVARDDVGIDDGQAMLRRQQS